MYKHYKHSSLFDPFVDDEGKKFYNVDTCSNCYKTFCGRKLQIFVVS
jgi:hypothetical protein